MAEQVLHLREESAHSRTTQWRKATGLNILVRFLQSTHDISLNETRGVAKCYEMDLAKLSPEVFCTAEFWEEFTFFVLYIYSGRSSRATAFKPLSIAEYLRKALTAMKDKFSRAARQGIL